MKLLKIGSTSSGIDERGDQHDRAEDPAGDRRPAAREATRAADQDEEHEGGGHDPDCLALDHVDQPLARRLRREPVVPQVPHAASNPNGRVTTRPISASTATPRTTRTHHGPRQPFHDPATGAREAQPARHRQRDGEGAPAPHPGPARELLGSRDLRPAVKTALAATGGGVPPGTGSQGTSTTARTTKATPADNGDHDAGPGVGPAHAAKSCSRSRHSSVNSRSLSPYVACSAAPTVGAVVHVAVEAHQPGLPAEVGQQPAGQPRGLVRRAEVRRRGVELGRAGQLCWRPVAAYPPDDLPGGHRDRQVHVAQRDVVGEALQQPQRHRAGGGVGGDVHGLVAHHHLRSARLEAAEDLRVDEDVHRRVRGERTRPWWT